MNISQKIIIIGLALIASPTFLYAEENSERLEAENNVGCGGPWYKPNNCAVK